MKKLVKVVLVFCVIFCFYTFVGQFTLVFGSSMETTLSNGDFLFMEKITKTFQSDYKRFQIIVFNSDDPDEPLYIKRIIALPGETIQLKNGEIFINGKRLNESYGYEKFLDAGIAENPITLSDDEYFVLGDNRNNSKDSRMIGPVQEESICGHIVFRLLPFSIFS